MWLVSQLGYVRLLGLPHIVVWTPLVVFLLRQSRRAEMPAMARHILYVIVAAMIISLAFDYVDVARYLMGERTPV